MRKPVIAGIVVSAALLGTIIYSSMNLAKFRVEVCMSYQGNTNCRTASGSTQEFAQRSATTNACAGIASGVTESMQCEQSTPAKITWLKK